MLRDQIDHLILQCNIWQALQKRFIHICSSPQTHHMQNCSQCHLKTRHHMSRYLLRARLHRRGCTLRGRQSYPLCTSIPPKHSYSLRYIQFSRHRKFHCQLLIDPHKQKNNQHFILLQPSKPSQVRHFNIKHHILLHLRCHHHIVRLSSLSDDFHKCHICLDLKSFLYIQQKDQVCSQASIHRQEQYCCHRILHKLF